MIKSSENIKFHDKPSSWVIRFAPLITGEVLDVACGKGRHTRFFLSTGNSVTAVDKDLSGLNDIESCSRLKLIKIDLEKKTNKGKNPLPIRPVGSVVVTNYLWRPLLPHIVSSVAKGHFLIYETFATGNEVFGKPKNPDYLLNPRELIEAVQDELFIVAYENLFSQEPRPSVLQRICAVRTRNNLKPEVQLIY